MELMRRIHYILALLLVTILTVAGPCPACPTPQAEKSAHDCCPGGKTTKKAPSKDDCPLIAYYLDVTKHGKHSEDLMAVLAEAPALRAMSSALPVVVARVDSGGRQDGRHAYLLHSLLLI
mgnify:CR=1 FL=1